MRTKVIKYDLVSTPSKMVGSFYLFDKKEFSEILEDYDGFVVLSKRKNSWNGIDVVRFKVNTKNEIDIYPAEHAKLNISTVKSDGKYLYTAPDRLVKNLRKQAKLISPNAMFAF